MILGQDHRIAEQGPWKELRSHADLINESLQNRPKSRTDEGPVTIQDRNVEVTKDPSEQTALDLTRKTGDTALYGMSIKQ